MFPQIFGKYVLERELAAGGMARVYLATLRGAVGFEKRLVVKQIRPELAVDQAFVRRFVEEAKTTVDLSHPNIVPVYELGVEQGVYYIAMELCAGVTLAEVMAHTGRLSPEEGAYLGVEICRALDYAHRRAGVVHRDVTPRNVLIDEEGAVRLIDFGIAAPVSTAGGGSAEIFGSPGHMPPEQLSGKALSPATDVFAVAALLVEAWTGRAPFRRKTARSSEAALMEPVEPLTNTDVAFAPLTELIARGLALDPGARPAHAELLARPLRDFLRNVDAGDVARRLGRRVQESRSRLQRGDAPRALPKKDVIGGVEGPRSGDDDERISSVPASSGGRVPTHTFAAREEVSEWTRRIGPTPAAPAAAPAPTPAKHESGPSTRKLPSMPPDSVADVSELGTDSITPEGYDDGARELSEPSRAGASGFSVGAAAASRRAPRPFVVRPGLLLALLVVVLAAAGVLARRGREAAKAGLAPSSAVRFSGALRAPPARSEVALDPAPASSLAPAVRVALSPTTSMSAPPPKRAGSAASAGAAVSATVPSASSSVAASPASSAASDVLGAALRVTADPPAGVSLQGPSGSRAFTTPAQDLALKPGVYVLTFRNDTYGQPVVTRVTLDAGASRSVHVDFREAEPRVSVR